MARTWRAEKRQKARGIYWFLAAGRNDDRVFLSLKYVTADQADAAARRMQAAEDDGQAQRVLDLHAEDPDLAVAFLLGDPTAASALPADAIDYARMTLRDYFDAHYREARSTKRPAGWRQEAMHWKRILADLGDVRLGEVDARDVYLWIRDLRIERCGGVRVGERRAEGAMVPTGERIAPASGAYKRLVRAALQACLKHAYLSKHVDVFVRLGELQIEGATAPSRDKVDPLSLEELARLLDAAHSPKHRAMWAVGAGQGMRPSELCRMEWPDVDWSGLLQVRGRKTDASTAIVPLTPISLRELRAWWEHEGQPESGPCWGITTYKGVLADDAERAGIGRRVTPYLLRHSFATIAWSLGVEKDVTRRIGRWTDEKMIDEVYCRPRPAELVAKVAKFDFAA